MINFGLLIRISFNQVNLRLIFVPVSDQPGKEFYISPSLTGNFF